MTVVDETIIVTPDLYQAVQRLADQGAEAIIIPIFTFQGFQLLLSLSYDYGLPVIFSAPQNAYRGGTIGGGFFGLYKQGAIAANMLIAYLNGDLDIASTAIYEGDDFAYAINLDAADLQDVDIPQAMLDGAAYVVENGQTAQGVTKQFPEVEITLPEMSLEERKAADLAFLADLACSDEMIAEQQGRAGRGRLIRSSYPHSCRGESLARPFVFSPPRSFEQAPGVALVQSRARPFCVLPSWRPFAAGLEVAGEAPACSLHLFRFADASARGDTADNRQS